MREFPERLEGFGRLMEGRIHLRCPKCGRKMRNIRREKNDHPKAVLVEILCPECVGGDFGEEVFFYDGNGDEICDPIT